MLVTFLSLQTLLQRQTAIWFRFFFAWQFSLVEMERIRRTDFFIFNYLNITQYRINGWCCERKFIFPLKESNLLYLYYEIDKAMKIKTRITQKRHQRQEEFFFFYHPWKKIRWMKRTQNIVTFEGMVQNRFCLFCDKKSFLVPSKINYLISHHT